MIRKFLVSSALVVSLCVGMLVTMPAAAAEGYPAYRAYVQLLDDNRKATDEIPLDDTQGYYAYFEKAYPKLLAAHEAAIAELRATSIDKDKQLADAIDKSKNKLAAYHQAIATKDLAQIGKAYDELEAANKDETEIANKQFEEGKAEDQSNIVVYGGLLAIFAALSLGTGWWALTSKKRLTGSRHDTAIQKLIAQARRDLFLSSLWGLGGALVTFVWYMVARQNGDTYYILYGPMLFGGLAFLQGLAAYRKNIKGQGFEMMVREAEHVKNHPDTLPGYMVTLRSQTVKRPDKKPVPAVLDVASLPDGIILKPAIGAAITLRAHDLSRVSDMQGFLQFLLKNKESYAFSTAQKSLQFNWTTAALGEVFSGRTQLNSVEQARHREVKALVKAKLVGIKFVSVLK